MALDSVHIANEIRQKIDGYSSTLGVVLEASGVNFVMILPKSKADFEIKSPAGERFKVTIEAL